MNRTFTLFITNNCNFRCKTCIGEYLKSGNLPLNLVKKILPQIKKLGYSQISFTGGEPALHPQFNKMVKLVKDYKLKILFISNGSLLERYKFLIQYKDFLVAAEFSLDGATKEVNDYIRHKNSYEKVKQSVNFFLSQGVETGLSVCLNKLNKHQIKEFLDLAEKWKVNSIAFGSIIETRYNQKIVLSEEEQLNCLIKLRNLLPNYQIECSLFNSLPVTNGIAFCPALNNLNSLAVNPNGELIFCCGTVGLGRPLGSLYRNSFAQLYNKYLNLLSSLYKLRLKLLIKGSIPEGFNTCKFCNLFL